VCVCAHICVGKREAGRESVCLCGFIALHLYALHVCVCAYMCEKEGEREREKACTWIGMHSISIQLIDSWVSIALHVCVCAYMCEKEGGRERESVCTWIECTPFLSS